MPKKVMLQGRYLGGHPGKSGQQDAVLLVDEDGVKVKTFKAFVDEPWTNISLIATEGPDQVAKRITATRLFLTGPFALAWRKEKKIGFVVVQGGFGEFLFEVKKKTPQELRGMLAPWATMAKAAAVPEAPPEPAPNHPPAPTPSAPPTPPPAASPLSGEREKVDLLRELGELRASGVLTDDEFEQQKTRILGS
jgi:Short C-terminal domain